LQPHFLHQAGHSFVVDGVTVLIIQPRRHPAIAVKRGAGIFPVDEPHQFQVQRDSLAGSQ
jgi:hypothetical protein